LATPWKNIFGYAWKNPLLVPTGKNRSNAHGCWYLIGLVVIGVLTYYISALFCPANM